MTGFTEFPPLNGLVLSGGSSTRMGKDKSLIKWHGKEQVYHVADLLKSFCKEVYISCREEQKGGLREGYLTISDRYENIGPVSGILSAFDFDETAAWFIVACDMPLLDAETFSILSTQRDPRMFATAFRNAYDDLPEPLVAIWEPASFILINQYLERGVYSPRKILLDNPVKLVSAKNHGTLRNVNTPAEAEEIMQLLNLRGRIRNS
jgi:molybdenum cofactor guanylyltransferase